MEKKIEPRTKGETSEKKAQISAPWPCPGRRNLAVHQPKRGPGLDPGPLGRSE